MQIKARIISEEGNEVEITKGVGLGMQTQVKWAFEHFGEIEEDRAVNEILMLVIPEAFNQFDDSTIEWDLDMELGTKTEDEVMEFMHNEPMKCPHCKPGYMDACLRILAPKTYLNTWVCPDCEYTLIEEDEIHVSS